MRNRTYGGVRGRETKVGRKLLRFPPTRLCELLASRYRTPLSLRDISRGRMELSDIWEFYFGGAGSQSLVCLFKRLFCILDYIGIC